LVEIDPVLLDLDRLASNLDALLDSVDSKDPPSVAAEEADGTCSTVQRLTMKAHQGCGGLVGSGRPITEDLPFGLCVEDLFKHSFHLSSSQGWFWIQKDRALAPDAERFPARKGEIRRFGASSRRIQWVAARKIDSRSFAEVAMDRRFQQGCNPLGSQRGR
jgi:hypothetical protein